MAVKFEIKKTIHFLLFLAFIILVIVSAYQGTIPEFLQRIPDFLGHFTLYGLLGLFAHRMLNRKYFAKLPLGVITILLLTIIEELTQMNTDRRTFSMTDMSGNISGIFFFYLVDLVFVKVRNVEPKEIDYQNFKESNLANNDKTAIVFGGTGLIGKQLIKLLCLDNRYNKIITFVRTKTGINNPKLEEQIIDFEHLEKHTELIKGHDMFCCIGTTIKKAGNREEFEKVDYAAPVRLAKIAMDNNFSTFNVISSIGAHKPKNNFYLGVKSHMENSVNQFEINRISILRPSLLLGKRSEKRSMERLSMFLLPLFHVFLIGYNKRYRAIQSSKVAKAMIRISNTNTEQEIFESDEIEVIGS